MKTFLLAAFVCLPMFSSAQPADAPKATFKKYVLVGVSGFKTGRPEGQELRVESTDLCKTCQVSGVWTNLSNLPSNHAAIEKRAYLTHFSKQGELDAAMKFLTNRNGSCRKDVGLVIMANSWGAAVANRFAGQYRDKCGRSAELFILVDGIVKPVTMAYRTKPIAKTCVNMYQTADVVHGAAIEGCQNIDLTSMVKTRKGIGAAHIAAEWGGTGAGTLLIKALLDRATAR